MGIRTQLADTVEDILNDTEETRLRSIGKPSSCARSGKRIFPNDPIEPNPSLDPDEPAFCLVSSLEIDDWLKHTGALKA